MPSFPRLEDVQVADGRADLLHIARSDVSPHSHLFGSPGRALTSGPEHLLKTLTAEGIVRTGVMANGAVHSILGSWYFQRIERDLKHNGAADRFETN